MEINQASGELVTVLLLRFSSTVMGAFTPTDKDLNNKMYRKGEVIRLGYNSSIGGPRMSGFFQFDHEITKIVPQDSQSPIQCELSGGRFYFSNINECRRGDSNQFGLYFDNSTVPFMIIAISVTL